MFVRDPHLGKKMDPDLHWNQSGSKTSVLDPWHVGTNPDPDLQMCTSDYRIQLRILQNGKQKISLSFSLTFFAYYFFEGTLFFKDKKS